MHSVGGSDDLSALKQAELDAVLFQTFSIDVSD